MSLLLNSRPGAAKTIFLKFNGYQTNTSIWENGGVLTLDPYYNIPALPEIEAIWKRVSEDFSPFDVNVTTQDPGVSALRNTGNGDTTWGITAVFTQNLNLATGNPITNAGGGGTAYLNTFNTNYSEICLIFNTQDYTAAETASHEIGHTMGLLHDGSTTGGVYYTGHGGSGPTSWGTIMGAAWLGTDEQMTQWSKGDYLNANNPQDDLAVITSSSNGITYRLDDHGNTTAAATLMSGASFSQYGVIETRTDVDMFGFTTTGAGHVAFNIGAISRAYINGVADFRPALGSNLDIAASLYTSTGSLIQTFNPVDDITGSFTMGLAAGTYFVGIDGVSTGTPMASTPTGYTDYGSLGQYMITGNATTTSTPMFNNLTDRITLMHDFAPDWDDGQSVVAEKVLMDKLEIRNYDFVGGAHGTNKGSYRTDSPAFMDSVIGAGKWFNAHTPTRTASAAALGAKWLQTLQSGGNVWVAEGGQLQFTLQTAQWVAANGATTAQLGRIRAFQHSTTNLRDYGTGTLDTFVALTGSASNHLMIGNGNSSTTDGTAALRSTNSTVIANFQAAAAQSLYAADWQLAFDKYAAANPGNNAVDFSDSVAANYILGIPVTSAGIAVPMDFANNFLQPPVYTPTQAEDFITSFDTTIGNQGSDQAYRPGVDTDIFRNATTGVRFVGNMAVGERMDYTINAPKSGMFNIDFQVATNTTQSRTFDVLINNALADTITFTRAGAALGWEKFAAETATVMLTGFDDQISIVAKNTAFNVDNFTITGPALI